MSRWFIKTLKILLPIAAVVSFGALVFVIIIINHSEWSIANSFPLLRDSVGAISTAAMVVATLFLVWATFMIVLSDRERERHDRKSAYFDEVIEWAEEIYKCNLKPISNSPEITEESAIVGEDVKPGSYFEKVFRWQLTELEELESEYRLLLSRQRYLEVMCNKLGSHFCKALKNTVEALAEHAKLLGKYIDEYGDSTAFDASTLNKRTRNNKAVGDHVLTIKDSAIKLIEEVTNSKANLIVS